MPFDWPEHQRLALLIVVLVDDGAGAPIFAGQGPLAPTSSDVPVHLQQPSADFRYGVQAGFPRLAALLDEYSVKVSIAVGALALTQASQLPEYARGRGHEICALGPIERAEGTPAAVAAGDSLIELLASLRDCGAQPTGWLARAVLGAATSWPAAVAGLRYCLSESTDDAPAWIAVDGQPRVQLPLAADLSDQNFLRAPALTPDHWLQYAIDSFDTLYAEGDTGARMMSLLLHPQIIGRPGRIHALEQFLQYATSKDAVWIATGGQIAAHFAGVTAPEALH